jgi:hypothetical protein
MFPVGTNLAKSCLDSSTLKYIVQVYSYACFWTPVNYDYTKYIKLWTCLQFCSVQFDCICMHDAFMSVWILGVPRACAH